MNELKTALENVDWSNPEKSFTSIARILMGNCVIRKGNDRYAIVEIEFYLYSKCHKDYITYPRETEVGQWFFHQSGVDLTFRSQGISKNGKDTFALEKIPEPQFGGVLIRGLHKLTSITDEDSYVFGPQKCVNELWDKFNALEPSTDEYPVIVVALQKDKLDTSNLIHCKRCINIDKDARIKKIKEWGKRFSVVIFEEDAKKYQEEMFDKPDSQRYRYFNLPGRKDPREFTKIPSSARPKQINKPE